MMIQYIYVRLKGDEMVCLI